MSAVYIVLWEDRHTDPVVELYATQGGALNRAKSITESYPDAGVLRIPGCLYAAQLTIEGDFISVKTGEVKP